MAKNIQVKGSGRLVTKHDSATAYVSSVCTGELITNVANEISFSLPDELKGRLFSSNWVARRMAESIASDMTSKGVNWRLDADTSAFLEKEFRRLNVWRLLTDAITYARVYGGSLVMIDMGDGAPESVLNPNGTLLGFRVFDKTEITPSTTVKNYGAEAGLPVKYSIQPAYGTLSTFDADASRVIRFDGIRSTHRKLNVNQGWGESVYDVANSAVSAYGASLDSCLELLKRCYIRYLGIENFWQGLQDDERASFMGRAVKMINDVQNNSSLTVSDNKDTFQSQSYSFGGIRDVLITFSEQIAGAAEIPLVKLFGMSPAGFSTGDADLANYYDTVSRLQEDKLREPISRIASLILTSAGHEVNEIDFDFVPLKQETTSERITNAQNAVNTILSVQAAGLISDKRALEEIAALSEKTGIFSTVTPQDIEALNEVEPPPIPNEDGQYVNAGLPNIGKAVDPNETPNFGAFNLN